MTLKYNPKTKNTALQRVRKHFPNVKKVVDAKEGIIVSVTDADSKGGRKKDPRNCALAKACVREGADGAIINIGFSYIVKDDVATRYKTSTTVGREITSFDRHQDFAEGKDYLLSKISPSAQIGKERDPDEREERKRSKKWKKAKIHHHRTSRIRVVKD